ncbi:MAG: hypothetical protein ACLU07_02090 [Lachnospirales bacterium]
MVDLNKIVGRWHRIKGPIKVFMGGEPIEFGTNKNEGTFILVENELYDEESEIWFVCNGEFIVAIKNDNNLSILREAGLKEIK